MRNFLITLAAATFMTTFGHAATRPNFVFFLVDDLGYMDVSPNNPNTFYETPSVQKLADSGMRFTEGYAACPVCSPTRASIMAGKYPARMQTTDYFGAPGPENGRWKKSPLLPAPYLDHLPLEEVTVAEALKEGGYATFFAGKWHLGGEEYFPEHQGFDVNMGGIDRGGPYGGKKYFSPYGNPRLPDGPEGEHLPDRLATEAVTFIEANKDKPFLTYVSFYSVHTPLIGRPDLVKKYQEKAKTVTAAGPEFIPEPPRQARQIQKHAVYAAMVEAMDQAVGKVLSSLDRLGLAENTVVIFTSDNGGLSTSEGSPTSNLPLRAGKGWMYEGGVREPWIVRWPGVTKPGSTCSSPVISTDFYPTILEMAGLPARPKQHVDGVSFAPLLRGGVLPQRDLFWHYPHWGNQGGSPGSAVRSGDYKLIEFAGDKPAELYRISDDIGEHKNLAATMPEKVAELKKRIEAFRQDTGAIMPTRNPDYKEK